MCSVCSSSHWLQALWRLVGAQPDNTMKSKRILQESARRHTDLTKIFFLVCMKQQISHFCCCGKQKLNSASEHAVFVHLGEIQGILLMVINSFATPPVPAKALWNKEGSDGLGGVEEAGDESPVFGFITLQTKEKTFLSRAQWQNITKYLLLHLISARFNLKIIK